jgi:hypothetical protein
MDEFEDGFMAGARVPHGRAKAGRIDCIERCHVPLMDDATLFEEIVLGCSLANVVLVVAGNRGRINAELDFGSWKERDVVLDGRGMAKVKSSGGFVSIYIEFSSE